MAPSEALIRILVGESASDYSAALLILELVKISLTTKNVSHDFNSSSENDN